VTAIVAILLAGTGLYFIGVQAPHTYVSKTKAPNATNVFSNTVAAVSGASSTGYAGFDNFTVPGPSGSLAALQATITVSGTCGGGTACEVLFTPSGLSSVSYSGLAELNTSKGSTFSLAFIMPVGSTEIIVINFPSCSYTYYSPNCTSSPFKVAVTVADLGILTLH
jgi:hypothetical protein